MRVDNLIIGGGLAGLSAAIGLVDAGKQVLVLESNAILGGRARSWIDPKTGDPIHIGPHIFLSTYPNMWRLLEKIGSKGKIKWMPKGHFITMVEGTRRIEIKESRLPPPCHMLPCLIRAKVVPLHHGIANWPITQLVLSCSEEDFKHLDRVNALAFLKAMGVPKSFIDWFWSFTCQAILNVPIELCSAGALLRYYRFQISHKGIQIGFADGGLGDIFAPQSRDYIEARGGEIRLGQTVTQLLFNGDRIEGAILRGGEKILAGSVVAALPPTALRKLIPREMVKRHRFLMDLVHFQPVPYISIYLWFDQKLTDLPFWARVHNSNDLGCDFYDLSNIHSGWEKRPSIITTNIIYSQRAAHMSDEELSAAIIDELAEFLPHIREAKLLHRLVNHIPMAIHCPYPGTEARRPANKSPIQQFYLAGDWTDTHFPSSMEGAVRSGWLAAEAILQDSGQPRKLACEQESDQGLIHLLAKLPRGLRARRAMRFVRAK